MSQIVIVHLHLGSRWLFAVWQHSCPSRCQRLSLDSNPLLTCNSLQKLNKYALKCVVLLYRFFRKSAKSNLYIPFFSLWIQTLGMLEAMSSNKQYAELEEPLNKAVQFIRYPGHCLKDGPRLLALLVNLLYSDLRYLHIIH